MTLPACAWNGLLAILSLAVGLAACEVALRLADTRYEQAAEPPVRKYHWANTQPHPDAKTEHQVLYNRFGNRQHRDFGEHEMEADTHIAFFGDSFTEGRRIPVQYTFAEVLDHLLNAQARKARREPREDRADAPARVHVHNFGVAGTGPGAQYLRYRGFAHKERLRHVFYVHCANDFSDLQHAGLYSLNTTGDLVRRMRRPTSAWIRFLSGLRLTYLALDVWQRLAETDEAVPGGASPPVGPQAIDDGDLVFEALLSRWRDEAEANGSAFHVVLLPRPDAAAFHRRVRPGLFDVVELRDCFDEEIPDYDWEKVRFREDGHWNETGHMVAAHCLYRFLKGRLELETASDETLARARHVYYRAFADDEGWQGHRFTPSAPWTSPAPVDAAEAARIRAKHHALTTDGEGQRRRIVRELRQGEPLARGGGWAVYASPRRRIVVYVKSPCGEGEDDPAGRLFLRGSWWITSEYAESREFTIPRGVWRNIWRDGGACVAVVRLHRRLVAKLYTGEWRGRPGGPVLWEAEFPLDSAERVVAVAAAYRRDYEAFANTDPKARSHWNIHVLHDRLALRKAPCDADDERGDFFLHMYPADPAEAAPEIARGRAAFRRPSGSEARFDGKCLLWRMLPNWRVATISAGEMKGDAVLWETTFHHDVERHQLAWEAVRFAAPAASGDFDVHRRGDDLVYVREPCGERDAAARFFLHVVAGGSRANLDFDFLERGVVADGRCVAVARLPPAQDIDRIRTGQFVAGEGNLWSVEI